MERTLTRMVTGAASSAEATTVKSASSRLDSTPTVAMPSASVCAEAVSSTAPPVVPSARKLTWNPGSGAPVAST